MKILEKNITLKGFDFKQLFRNGKFAIYEQTKSGYKFKKYEAVIIESHNGYELAGQYFPPSEMYPSTSMWGVKGFTMESYDDAVEKIKYLEKAELKRAEKEKNKK